jgi:hypothetical protein
MSSSSSSFPAHGPQLTSPSVWDLATLALAFQPRHLVWGVELLTISIFLASNFSFFFLWCVLLEV